MLHATIRDAKFIRCICGGKKENTKILNKQSDLYLLLKTCNTGLVDIASRIEGEEQLQDNVVIAVCMPSHLEDNIWLKDLCRKVKISLSGVCSRRLQITTITCSICIEI